MAYKGQTISNKITGETITWQETAADNNGKKLVFHFEVAPKGYLPVRHLHPNQVETFEITKGAFKVELNGELKTFCAGERLVIPKGAPHQWWNVSDSESVEMTVTFEPALNTETFLEQFFGICNDGKTKADGTPPFLQMMAMVNTYQLYIAGPPIFIQKVMGFVLGGIGQMMGFKKYYKQYSHSFTTEAV
ncbi:MAG: cupin domain-containing protein [Saprospiraceae bacterium]|nr:cupin domain-containing protein [Saprospiraceae bacterium]